MCHSLAKVEIQNSASMHSFSAIPTSQIQINKVANTDGMDPPLTMD